MADAAPPGPPDLNDALVVFVYVDDLERSADFYGRLLELPLVLDQGSCRLFQVATNGFVGVCGSGDRPTTPDGVIVTLVRNDVDEYCDRLAANGVIFEQPPRYNERFGIHHAFLRDPDGYLLEVQRFDDVDWHRPLPSGSPGR